MHGQRKESLCVQYVHVCACFWFYIFVLLLTLLGQKGIGFKSVFRVTDEPEIHSNGYHIKFDVNSGPTGYILPHWVEEDKWKEGQG